jgi:hypothetical protein
MVLLSIWYEFGVMCSNLVDSDAGSVNQHPHNSEGVKLHNEMIDHMDRCYSSYSCQDKHRWKLGFGGNGIMQA